MTARARHTPPKPRARARPAVSRGSEIRTISFVSLGCPKNLVDSEKMLGLLAQDGLAVVSHDPGGENAADAIVVNTCGFLEASKEESLEVIHEAIRAKERAKPAVKAGAPLSR
ncbi:MAG TPA: hypothetical protein VEJ18_12350 [Planctomycetota bacterium]|nr:hypothetical protein [Planctomycetota bacterium]